MRSLLRLAGRPAWERGLTPTPSPPKTALAKSESFKRVVRPDGDMLAGEIYPDGSALDGMNPKLMGCGCSVVSDRLRYESTIAVDH